MNAKPCAVEDILLLNKTKEYTLTATFLLETVLTDTNLNAHAAKLWQVLFSKAKFHPNLELRISYIELGQILCKSIRTINRYIATLAKHGYLLKHNNFLHNGGQTINTLYVRFPQASIEQAKKSKNRKCNNDVTPEKPSLASDTTISTMRIKQGFVQGNPDAIFDSGAYVTSDIHKDNIEKDNNNKNNTVVCFSRNLEPVSEYNNTATKRLDECPITHTTVESPVEKLKQQLAKHKKQLDEISAERVVAENAWLSETNLQQKIVKQDKFGQINAAYQLMQGQSEQLEKQLQRLESAILQQNKLVTNKQHVSDMEGKRVISPFAFKYLERNLRIICRDNSCLAKILNEIMYEVRFGSLRFSKTTGAEISIQHGINIALKLIRENRWRTPVDLDKLQT